MRELTKSLLSFSWALPLFGMKQMMGLAMPRDPSRPFGKVTDDFQAVTGIAQGQLEGAWNRAFQAGDQLQRGVVDLMFSFLSPEAWNPNRMMRMTSDVMRSSVNAAGQMAEAATDAAAPPTPASSSPVSPPPGWKVSAPNV
ncbi:MAG TPA: hypothetical protein VF173_21755 [Thermoanaerobaculia bacterium]|nr:hypothetical protein [Thermoanaerobaculia bacterium]